MLVVGVVRSKGPFHGRVFRGGCSRVEYQRIAAVVFSSFLVRVSDGSGTVGGGWRGLVFGTLLGPEATGPRAAPVGGCWWDFVSGFLAAPIMHGGSFVVGLCVGCVVWGCCLRTT